MRGEIGEILSNKVEQASKIIAREGSESIRSVLGENIENTVYRLNEAVGRAKDKFQYFYDLDKKRIILIILGLVVLPIVASFLVAKLAMPKPIVLNVDGKTCAVYMQESRGYYGTRR